MKFSRFFQYSWIIQLIVGISLFSVSFLIEHQVLQAFIAAPLLALLLAASLELGKAAAIIWHRYMIYQIDMGYPTMIKYISASFRAGLLLLSMLCSLLFLAGNLDRPHIDQVRSEEITRSETRLEEALQRADTRYQESLEQFKQNQQHDYKKRQQSFTIAIKQLEQELSDEMDNVVKGVFQGPRYEALQTRINAEKQRQNQTLQQLAKQQATNLAMEIERLQKQQETARQQAYQQADQQRDNIINNDYANDERANDGKIVAFLKVLQSVFSTEIQPLQFVFLFSLLLSLLTELGIVLAFDTVTLSILPALKSAHEANLNQDILQNEIDIENQQDQLRQQAALNRVNNSANEVIKKASEYLKTNQAQTEHSH